MKHHIFFTVYSNHVAFTCAKGSGSNSHDGTEADVQKQIDSILAIYGVNATHEIRDESGTGLASDIIELSVK